MDEKIAYYNDLIVRLEEIFYHELSHMVHPKMEYVGIDYLKDKNIQGNTVEEVVESCIKEMKAGGLIEDMTHSIAGAGLLLILNVKGCIHVPMEAKLKKGFKGAGGVEPYLCPIANMVLDRIINLLNYEMVYNAQMEIDADKKECRVKCAIYESMEKIGQVGDWETV